MARVTAITPQERQPDRYNLFLDGQFALGLSLDTLVRHGLRVGDELSPAALAALQDDEGTRRALDDALRFLSFRPRSVMEVQRYLARRQVEQATAERVLDRLQELGLLDDRQFAARWVENRQAFSPRGPRALRAELRQKGVAQPEIEEALQDAGDDGEATAEALARSRLSRLRGLDAPSFRKKLGEFLMRRGFDYDVARRVADRLWREQGSPDDAFSDPDE
jgi:regulatory protein